MTLVTLYQAEWCPFSSAVRELLTELGIDAIVRQVEPWPEQRARLRELAGTDQIPVLQAEDGQFYRGIHEIFAHLRERQAWEYAADHRRRFKDHRAARESDAAGRMLKQFSASELDPSEPRSTSEQASVVDVPGREPLRAAAGRPADRPARLSPERRPDRVHPHRGDPGVRGTRIRKPAGGSRARGRPPEGIGRGAPVPVHGSVHQAASRVRGSGRARAPAGHGRGHRCHARVTAYSSR